MFWRQVRRASYRRDSIMQILRALGTNVLMCMYQHTSKPVRGPTHSFMYFDHFSVNSWLFIGAEHSFLFSGQTDFVQMQGVIPSLVKCSKQMGKVLRASSSSLMNEGRECLTIQLLLYGCEFS